MRLPVCCTVAVTAGLVMAGCGPADPPVPAGPSGPPNAHTPSPRAQLAAHAAAAKDLTGVRFYELVTPDELEHTIMVELATDGTWRVDITGGALDGAADIALIGNEDGLFSCELPTDDRPDPATCVQVEQLHEEHDPRVQRVFTDWLDVFTDRSAALSVAPAEALTDVAGQCFAVEGGGAALAAPVDPGIYCYDSDGTLTGARLSVGTLTLSSTGQSVLDTVELPGEVVDGDPLPLESPPPSPSPSPSPGSAGAADQP